MLLTAPFASQYTDVQTAAAANFGTMDSWDSVPVNEDQISDLIEATATRDKAAFADLFRYFAPRVKAYGMKAGAGAALADELAQETMVSVWRGAHRFQRSRGNASTWIFTIARNRRIDLWRRESHPEIDPDDPDLGTSPAIAPDAAHETEETGRHLRDAVDELPEEQAAVLHKAFFEDKSHGAISDELGIPLGTVKSRVRLGLARLRVLMAGFQA